MGSVVYIEFRTKITFQTGPLCNPHGSLFLQLMHSRFSRCHVTTKSAAPSPPWKQYTTLNSPIRSDEGQTFDTSALIIPDRWSVYMINSVEKSFCGSVILFWSLLPKPLPNTHTHTQPTQEELCVTWFGCFSLCSYYFIEIEEKDIYLQRITGRHPTPIFTLQNCAHSNCLVQEYLIYTLYDL